MGQIEAIQVLRAVAALLVVFSHAQNDASYEAVRVGDRFARSTLLPWDAGVDLFFVISGFIMVYASQRLFGTRGATSAFLGRRVVRIVPLYWIVTGITLIISGYVAWLGKRAFPAAAEIVSSLAFVPFTAPGALDPRPLVPLGWTLNYEMFFYGIFAMFVGLRRGTAVLGASLTLVGAVAAGAVVHPHNTALAYWSDPIVLEFVLGMGLAMAWRHGMRVDRWVAAALLAVGLGVLQLDLNGMTDVGPIAADANGFGRLFASGVPMALIFSAVVFPTSYPASPGSVFRWGTRVGDASYALYLFHPLVVIFARKAYLAVGLQNAVGYWPLILADLPLAVCVALLIHLTIEKPVTERLQASLNSRRQAGKTKVLVPKSRTI